MSRILSVRVIVAVIAIAAIAEAGGDRPVRQARSENGRFELRLRPGRPSKAAAIPCRATLIERNEDLRGRATRWEADFVNELAPLQASVRDDGRFVVTLDEYRYGGARHAVAIYDAEGKLAREFTLQELLSDDEMPHVKTEGESQVWLEDATCGFDDALPRFFIKLAWQRELRIDLEKLELVDARIATTQPAQSRPSTEVHAAAGDDAAALSPEELLAMLVEADPTDPRTVELKELLEAAAQQVDLDQNEAMAAAIAARQQALSEHVANTMDFSDAHAPEWSWELQDAEPLADAEPDTDALQTLSEDEDALDPDDLAQSDEFALPELDNLSDDVGVPVPRPDPADPVDYVAWINAYTDAGDSPAADLYVAASEATVRNELDGDLLSAALHGDSDALNDSAVQQWIADNQTALADFRAATQHEFNGYNLQSEDGSLIGVMLPTLGNLRELSRVTIAEGKMLEMEGRTTEAIDGYLDAMAAGSQAGRGVTLIENLVGTAVDAVATEALLDAYAADVDDSLDYAALAERVAATDKHPRGIAEIVQFERAMVSDVAQRLYEPDPATGELQPSESGREFFGDVVGMIGEDSGLQNEAMRDYLTNVGFDGLVGSIDAHYDELTDALLGPYDQTREAFTDIESRLSDPAFRTENPVLHALLPAISRAVALQTRGAATRRATNLVTNLRAYRQQFGEYPASLDAFGDTDFAYDPFTSQPFTYRREGDDFVLYSVGHNGVDDGGVNSREVYEGDVQFWPRPPRE